MYTTKFSKLNAEFKGGDICHLATHGYLKQKLFNVALFLLFMIITVSGTPGSGKSTIAKALAKNFRLKYFSSGDLMRNLAEKKGISLAELNKLAEDNPSVVLDKDIVYEGQIVHGVKVIKVHKDRVEFEKEGKRWEQKLKEEPNMYWIVSPESEDE